MCTVCSPLTWGVGGGGVVGLGGGRGGRVTPKRYAVFCCLCHHGLFCTVHACEQMDTYEVCIDVFTCVNNMPDGYL